MGLSEIEVIDLHRCLCTCRKGGVVETRGGGDVGGGGVGGGQG